MVKSIAVVVGSYLLSVVLVLATDPLLSRLFPGDFVRGRVPSDAALVASTALFVVVSILGARRRATACALVFRPWGSDGHRRDHSQLEQGLAALVLVVVDAHLAGELLDRVGACQASG